MNHLINFAILLAFCALLTARIIVRALTSTEKLKQVARRDELLPKLLPYACGGDRARLQAEMGSVSRLRALGKACGATAALIERASASGIIQAQTRSWWRRGRWVIRAAMVETGVRKSFPARQPSQPMFLLFAVQVYLELAVTLEALEALTNYI